MTGHIPVLLNEVLNYINPGPGKQFIDCTAGSGGHSIALLNRITPEGRILGIEIDKDIFAVFNSEISRLDLKNLELVNDSYTNIKKIAERHNFNQVDGILFDLGLSSWQLEESGRGFSFQKDEPLIMRFDGHGENGATAEEIINRYSYDELVKVLKDYGEERFARSIAGKVVSQRKNRPIKTTLELVNIVAKSVPGWYRKQRIHFATKTFQALRIAVNRELENIKLGISEAIDILKPSGRILVISFHSLEDKIIKNFFKEQAKVGNLKILTKKPIVATKEEVRVNPRSRSAKLRMAEKL